MIFSKEARRWRSSSPGGGRKESAVPPLSTKMGVKRIKGGLGERCQPAQRRPDATDARKNPRRVGLKGKRGAAVPTPGGKNGKTWRRPGMCQEAYRNASRLVTAGHIEERL